MTPRQFTLLLHRHSCRHADMMAFHAEMKRDPAKHPRPFTASDFTPRAETTQPKGTGLGPEVFHAFEAAFSDG